jgi:glycosyltransferase involved in cell wall biosynthesis
MHVVYLNPVGTIGGAERVLLLGLRELGKTDPSFRRTLLTMSDGPLETAARALGVETVRLNLPKSLAGMGDSVSSGNRWEGLARSAVPGAIAGWNFTRRLRTVLAHLKPDLIHSNGIKCHMLCHLARPSNARVIWHIHDFVGLRPLVGRVLSFMRGSVTGAIAISKAVASDFRKQVPGLPVALVPNAVDVDQFSPGRTKGGWIDEQAGLGKAPRKVTRFGLVATYARWKGHLHFLEAAARMVKAEPKLPLRFYLIGGPIYQTNAQFRKSELQAAIKKLGLEGIAGLVPFQPEPVQIYRTLDVVVHASTQPEPFGLTIAEAMSCGRAVIATDAGGAREIFTSDWDALGVMPNDVDALTDAMLRLGRDSRLREQLARQARSTILEHFTPAKTGPAWQRIYLSTLKKPL